MYHIYKFQSFHPHLITIHSTGTAALDGGKSILNRIVRCIYGTTSSLARILLQLMTGMYWLRIYHLASLLLTNGFRMSTTFCRDSRYWTICSWNLSPSWPWETLA